MGLSYISRVYPIFTAKISILVASIHNIIVESINGEELHLGQFKGKKLLIVNVASACGYTPQYEQLEMLHRTHHQQLAILGCPCNDYGGQESGTEEDILNFCRTMYDVTFPLTKKINILTQPVSPLYIWLTSQSENGVADSEVTWNFQKYAIGPQGEWQGLFAPDIPPLDEHILDWIEAT